MKVRIVGQDSYAEKEVQYIECHDSHGNVVILQGHAPRLFVARADKPFFLHGDGEAKEQLLYAKILVSVDRELVTIIVT